MRRKFVLLDLCRRSYYCVVCHMDGGGLCADAAAGRIASEAPSLFPPKDQRSVAQERVAINCKSVAKLLGLMEIEAIPTKLLTNPPEARCQVYQYLLLDLDVRSHIKSGVRTSRMCQWPTQLCIGRGGDGLAFPPCWRLHIMWTLGKRRCERAGSRR